jgi:hypothetical protein
MLECSVLSALDWLLVDGKSATGKRPAEACGCHPNRKHHKLSRERGDV